MKVQGNPFRGQSASLECPDSVPFPSVALAKAQTLVARCPQAQVTPLHHDHRIADACGIADVMIKDERERMDLGSFKALGAAYVIASEAMARDSHCLPGVTYVTASAGNHGLSVAAGARIFGARAVVYIAETVPESFAGRLRAEGAEVVREGAIYEDSMAAAMRAASDNDWQLLSDTSWDGYVERPHRLMEGYLVLMAEVFEQIDAPPSHIFLQAGVGGLAGAAAAAARHTWGDHPTIIVVEPEAAPALADSISAGRAVVAEGPVSAMGRLDCKEPSLIALKGLARDADLFSTITEAEAASGTKAVADFGYPSTPSGAAGLAALLRSEACRDSFGLDASSRALTILSEGPEV